MFSSKKFVLWVFVGCAVALCLGMLAGSNVSAQEPPSQPTVLVSPPVAQPVALNTYQQFLARLFHIKAEIARIESAIRIREILAQLDPEDVFLKYDLEILWFQLGMLQMELTEVRLALSVLSP